MENDKVHVLQVVWNLGVNGGIQSMLHNQVKYINTDKVQYDFLVHTENKGELESFFESKECKIFRAPLPAINKNVLTSINSMFRNYRFMREFYKNHREYQTIHIHIAPLWTKAYIAFLAKKFGIKNVLMHSHVFLEKNKFSTNVAKKVICRFSDYYLACSTQAGKWLYGNKEFLVVNNSIETKNFIYNHSFRLKKKQQLKIDNKLVVGHIGRFNEQKNHEFLIEIFNNIHIYEKNAILLLIGEGELEPKILNSVKKYGLEDVVFFLGNRLDINELYQVMDVFVFPSKYEGLGIVTIEAQASGLKTIVSEKIPQDAHITNLIETKALTDDAEKWAEIVVKYLKSGYERRDMYLEIKNSGYDIEDTVDLLCNLYIQISK